MKPLAISAVVVALLTLTACSSSPAKGDGRACEPVSADLMSRIAEGAASTPITPIEAVAVKSKAFKDAYIVAMTFSAPDVENQTGVWATTAIEGGPSILAVDGFAHQFTKWPNVVNGTKLNVTEDGVPEAKACLNGK